MVWQTMFICPYTRAHAHTLFILVYYISRHCRIYAIYFSKGKRVFGCSFSCENILRSGLARNIKAEVQYMV